MSSQGASSIANDLVQFQFNAITSASPKVNITLPTFNLQQTLQQQTDRIAASTASPQ
jgi:hypothetical protein